MSYQFNVKKSPQGDWHKADILAALRKAGWSLASLAMRHGYKRSTLNPAIYGNGWPRGEEIIAAAIRDGDEYPDIQPQYIWPSRYSDKSKSTRRKLSLHVKSKRSN